MCVCCMCVFWGGGGGLNMELEQGLAPNIFGAIFFVRVIFYM